MTDFHGELYTASKVARSTNVIAASGEIAVDVFVAWQQAFYGSLASGESVFNVFELANAVSNAVVVLHLKKDFLVAAPEEIGTEQKLCN